MPKINLKKLKKIKCLATDVDGVLTDGIIYLGDSSVQGAPQWRRRFYIRDGLGLLYVQKQGIKTAFITSSRAEDIQLRAQNLKIDFFYDNAEDKASAFKQLIKASGFLPEEIIYIGDDVIDLPIFALCGIACAPADAHPKVKKTADIITRSGGGRGAVREICDLLLELK